MKKIILITVAMMLILTGCTQKQAQIIKKVKPVSTEVIKKTTRPVTIAYSGIAANSNVKQYAFYQVGEIKDINVAAGDKVTKDQILAAIKVPDIDAPIELIADADGVVVNVMNKVGDTVEQGYPVVLVRPTELFMQLGVTAQDLKHIALDTAVSVESSAGDIYEAVVFNINHVPDETTRTYPVTVKITKGETISLGSTLLAYFKLDVNEGIWLPIAMIENDGNPYVFIVEDGRAKRIDITILNTNEDFAQVEGLNAGQALITSGANTLTDGYLVEIIQAGNDDE